ncbi:MULTISPECIES: sacsin N-terminal ATP-binding-like domain-containing protein [unclassified Empedobacter]|uniref:sacsin N-terminal ATP-binding-like domain-containing protein n=1 Tax=unclassified Empedobacter TaxID=2643773 RepID=UPI0025C114EF|nr:MULTISPECIES: DUF3883 domain-containing protein [unclassified Empedobacter]
MLKEVLRKHYANYTNQSVENIKRDAKGLLHIISDYEGRVVFELLQNAFDRADKNIRICIKNGLLYVANDGTPFTYVLDFDYENGDNTIRGDFQSICSVYTSSKTVSSAIGNKGIGFKSVFSIAKKQNPEEVYPTRSVDIFTKGQFIDAASKTSQMGAFRLYEMIRLAEVLTSIFNDADLKIQQEKIRNAQKEYPDTGIPGYYFPIEIDTQEAVVQDLFAQGYCTVIAIELEDSQIIGELIKQNLVQNGIHFEFIQLKHQNKPFQVSIALDEEHLMTKEVKLNNPNLIHCTINDEKLIQLAQNAGIDVETINIGLYLRADDKGKLYNYLPTDVASPFPFVDFHADFRTTLNRKNINWDGAVGEYNKALLQACIELLFTLWKPEDLQLNTTYINDSLFKPTFNYRYILPNFDINSKEAALMVELFSIKTERWNLDFSNWTNWLAYNFSLVSVSYKSKDFQILYNFIIKWCSTLTNDYNLSVWSRVDGYMSDLINSFRKYDVTILPNLKISESREVFATKEVIERSSFLPVYFTDVEFGNEKLSKALGVKSYSTDLNEILKYFKQCDYSNDNQQGTGGYYSEIEQIELLNFVYDIYKSRRDRDDSYFAHRYTHIFSADLRERNSVRNQANFNLSTLFLKTKDGLFRPAQLCCLSDLDDDFRAQLKFNDGFLCYLGVSSQAKHLVYDERIYNKYNEGLKNIPELLNEREPINSNFVLYCRISKDEKVVHPALINDNYVDLFPIIKLHHLKVIKPTATMLLVKNYEQFSTEYFNILKDYLVPYLQQPSFYSIIRNFFAYTFSLFHRNNHWIIFNGVHLEVVTHIDFVVLKTKTDLDQAFEQRKSNFLIYESDKGLFDVQVLENKVISFDEEISFNETNVKEITNDIFYLFKDKLVYILYHISHDTQSERDFIVNDSDILNRIAQTKILVVENFAVRRTSEFLSYNYPENYRIDNKKIYLADETPKVICKAISEWLFSTNRFAEKIEVILFNRTSDDLVKECDSAELKILNQKYNWFYKEQEDKFISLIKAEFPEVDISEDHWNFETSNSMQALKNVGKFDSFRSFFAELKYSEDFKDYDFGLDIIYSSNEIEDLKVEISQQPIKNEELDFLYHKLSKNLESKNIVFSSQSDNIIKSSNRSIKKKVIKNIAFDSSSSEELETIGSNGEHEVLNYFVNKYYQLDTGDRKVVLNSIFELIKGVVDDIKYFEELKDELLINLSSNDTLKTLIPYLYITNKYKYSYFDLVGFEGVDACFVEVKTTSSNRRDFYISQAEIDCALKNENYQIVRVNSEEIIFLGNPIEKFKDQLNGFQNSQYKLTFTKYKIEII